jgi:hypothetical protein
LFAAAQSTNYLLVRIEADGKTRALLDKGREHWLFAPISSPDGRHLAFSQQTFENNVWLLEHHPSSFHCPFDILPAINGGDSYGNSLARDCFGGFLPQPAYFTGGQRRGFTLWRERTTPGLPTTHPAPCGQYWP